MRRSRIKRYKFRRQLEEIIVNVTLAIILTALLRTFVFSSANVDGNSMNLTLLNKDVVFVEKVSQYFSGIKRSTIVIFDSPYNESQDFKEVFVKRVIGLEGDKVKLKDNKIYINGTEIQEDYLQKDMETKGNAWLNENDEKVIPKGQVFVMGDNRSGSLDSRAFGPINKDTIKGRVFLRILPFNTIAIF